MLMAIQGNQAVVYVYELVDGKQKVVQTTFSKNGTEIIKKEEKKIEEKKVVESESVLTKAEAPKEEDTESL